MSASGRKGTFRWRFDPGTDKAWAGDVACCGVNNRGVALWKDKVIWIWLPTAACSRSTRRPARRCGSARSPIRRIGETITMAPLVVRDVAIVGPAGSKLGIRGFIDGTDLNTGKQLWRAWGIPGAGEPGNETWKDGKNHWQHGGGSLVGDRHLRRRHRHDLPGHRQCRSGLRWRNIGPATTNGPRACSRSIRRAADPLSSEERAAMMAWPGPKPRGGSRIIPHAARPAFLRAQHGPQRRVDIGDVVASQHPLRLHTVLGSCIAVCLWDPVAGAGGMNHILVPSSRLDCQCGSRCGVHAMELLINALMQLGAERRHFVAKAFGAGNVLPVFQTPTVGDLNARFVRDFLRTENIPLVAERLGGDCAVRVVFHAQSGRAFVHTVDGSRLPEIVHREIAYFNKPVAERFPDEEPILF